MAITERERKVQSKVISIVRRYGSYAYKNAQGCYTEKGRPDLSVCVPVKVEKLIELFGKDGVVGLFIGLEIKRDGLLNTVSSAQEIVGRKIKQAGGIWFAIDDPDVAEALMIKLTGEYK